VDASRIWPVEKYAIILTPIMALRPIDSARQSAAVVAPFPIRLLAWHTSLASTERGLRLQMASLSCLLIPQPSSKARRLVYAQNPRFLLQCNGCCGMRLREPGRHDASVREHTSSLILNRLTEVGKMEPMQRNRKRKMLSSADNNNEAASLHNIQYRTDLT